jgi:hypothetical protein
MVIRVELGKGGKDRFAMLSPQLLELRAWLRRCRSKGWLFPGKDPLLPLTTRQLNRACHLAAEAARLGSWASPHTLRHSFAWHLLEMNTDVRVIQVLLGHAKVETAAPYTPVATNIIRAMMSPLERLLHTAADDIAEQSGKRLRFVCITSAFGGGTVREPHEYRPTASSTSGNRLLLFIARCEVRDFAQHLKGGVQGRKLMPEGWSRRQAVHQAFLLRELDFYIIISIAP